MKIRYESIHRTSMVTVICFNCLRSFQKEETIVIVVQEDSPDKLTAELYHKTCIAWED